MSSWPRTIGILVSVGVALACSREDPRATASREGPDRHACSISVLGRLLTIDTAGLRRVIAPATPGESSEGGRIVIFLSGDAPRMIHADYFGEMGRSAEDFYVLDERSFVRVRTVTTYVAPLSDVPNGTPATVTRDTVWVCQGRAVPAVDSVAAIEALTTLQAIVRHRR